MTETGTRPHVDVVDDPEAHAFVARLDDGTQAGAAYYRRRAGVVIFTHTIVESEFEGRGIGSQLAKGALDAVREAGEKIQPLCPFIRAYVDKHPEYHDLRNDGAAGA